MQSVRVVFVRLLSRPLQPCNRLAGAPGLLERPLQKRHPKLEHRRSVPQRGRLAIERSRPRGLLSRPRSDLIAHRHPIRGGRVVLFGRLEIQVICPFMVDLESQRAGSMAIRQKELGLVIGLALSS